jgi:hypothetical protein
LPAVDAAFFPPAALAGGYRLRSIKYASAGGERQEAPHYRKD